MTVAVVMFVETNNADNNLLCKSAEQSAMDELALSFFAVLGQNVCLWFED